MAVPQVGEKSAAPEDNTCMCCEDSPRQDSRSHDKPGDMRFRLSETDSFLGAVSEDAYQNKNPDREKDSTHDDLREVLKGSGVLFLFLTVQAYALILVFVIAPGTHPIKLSLSCQPTKPDEMRRSIPDPRMALSMATKRRSTYFWKRSK